MPWISTQILAVVGPKTQSWSLAAVQAQDNFMACSSSPDRSAQDSPCGWHGPQKPPPQVSFWPSVVAGAMGIDADHGCRKVTNSDMALGRSPGPDNTMSPGGKQASHTNLFFTALTSSDLSLSVAHGPLSAPFSPYPTIYSLPIMELIPTLSEQTALS